MSTRPRRFSQARKHLPGPGGVSPSAKATDHTDSRPISERKFPFLPLLPLLITLIAFGVLFTNLGSANPWDIYTWADVQPSSAKVSASDGVSVYRLFIFCTALLILLNNILLYLPDVFTASESSVPNAAIGRRARFVAFYSGIAATVGVLFWLQDIAKRSLRNSAVWEWVGIGLFILFSLLDGTFWYNCRGQDGPKNDFRTKTKIQQDLEYYRGLVLFTDLPVVVGLFFVSLIIPRLSRFAAAGPTFTNGFLSGAVGMHLAYSQFVFVVLALRYRMRNPQVG